MADYPFGHEGWKFVPLLAQGSVSLTVDDIRQFISDTSSSKEGDIVVVDGVGWSLVVEATAFGDKNYLNCYLLGARDGTWRRFVDGNVYIQKGDGSTANNTRVHWLFSAPEGSESWGCHRFIDIDALLDENNGYVVGDRMTITADFSVGIDRFARNSVEDGFDVRFIVEEQEVFSKKGFLKVHSRVFAEKFAKNKKKKKISLPDTKLWDFVNFLGALFPSEKPLCDSSTQAVYKLAENYKVEGLLRRCEDHIRQSKGLTFTEKLVMAEERHRTKFRDLLIASMTADDLTDVVDAKEEMWTKLGETVLISVLEKCLGMTTSSPLDKLLLAQKLNNDAAIEIIMNSMTTADLPKSLTT